MSPQPIADGAEGMDVDAGEVGEGPEPMTIDRVDEGSEGEGSEEEEGDTWLNNLILQTQADVWNTFCLKESGCVFPVVEGNGDFFVEEFGGQKVRVDIPESSFDELTGAALDFEQVKQGMKTEVQQLERLKVGRCLVERDGRALAKEKLKDRITPHVTNFFRLRLTIQKQEGKRKYKSDGAVMVGEFVCMYVCSCTVSE